MLYHSNAPQFTMGYIQVSHLQAENMLTQECIQGEMTQTMYAHMNK
jgi:hypothetical protein